MPQGRSRGAPPFFHRRRLAAIALAFVAACCADFAAGQSDTRTWSNAPVNNQWGQPLNWSATVVPSSTERAAFTQISTSSSIDLGGARTVHSVRFGGLSQYALNSGTLTLASGLLEANSAFIATSYFVNVPVVLGAAGIVSTGDLATLTVSQAISDDNQAFGLTHNGGGTLVLTGGSITSLHTLTQDAGTLDINGGSVTVRHAAVDAFPISLSATTRVRGGGKLIGSPGGNLRLGTENSRTLAVQGAGSEVKDLNMLVIGNAGRANLQVENGGKLSNIGTLVVGGDSNSDSTALIVSGAQVQTTFGALGSVLHAEGIATVDGQGTLWQTADMHLGTFHEFDDDGDGVLVVSNNGAVTVSGETRFFGDQSALLVNGGTYSTARLVVDPLSESSVQITNPAAGKALVLTNNDVNNTPTFSGVIVDSPHGPGGLRKTGAGAHILAAHNTYTGGTIVEGGTLSLGTGDALAPTGDVEISGGTLDLGGHAQHVGDFKLTGGALAGAAGSTLVAGDVDVSAGTIAVPLSTLAGITKQGSGTVTATAPINAGALVVIGGVLDAQAGVNSVINVGVLGELKIRKSIVGSLLGNLGSTAMLTGPTIIEGQLQFGGTLEVGPHALVIDSPTTIAHVEHTTLAGGVITLSAIIAYEVEDSLSGYGTAAVAIQGDADASITASAGPLILGSYFVGDSLFSYEGALDAGAQQLNLQSAGYTSLGGAATIAGGSINSVNGARVNAGKTLSGHGVVNGAFRNLGTVTGGAGANVLRFTGPVTGGGGFNGNVQFDSTYGPGASPASVNFVGNPTFAVSSRLEIELGGTTEGADYDHLEVVGSLTLGGALDVSLINGFTPLAGTVFNILDWSTLTGQFSSIELPQVSGLFWDASRLYTDGELSVVAPLAADFNVDGDVDSEDLAAWRTNLGAQSANRAMGDADGNQSVDGRDFLVWQQQVGSRFLPGSAAPTSSTVPEPAAALLAAIALATLAAARRRPRRD